MVISVLAAGFAIGALILMVLTRKGQPRMRRSGSDSSSFIFWGGDGGSGGDPGCDSGSASDGGCSGGDGGGGGD
jgi:hypothetical protein